MKTWVITGGLGFIGINLIEELLINTESKIIILDNYSVCGPPALEGLIIDLEKNNLSIKKLNYNNRVELIQCCITDQHGLEELKVRGDVLVHLAANTGVGPSVLNPTFDMMSNVSGTLNMLEFARKNNIPKFIFASSGAPAGDVAPPITENIVPRPVSPYGASKLAGEGYCSAYHHSFGLETIALRFSNVYGPHSAHKQSVVARFINQALKGQAVEIFGDGSQTRDFIHVSDLVRAIITSTDTEGVGGEVYQIATNIETTVHEVYDLIKKNLQELAGVQLSERFEPKRIGDVERNFADISKARLDLKWEPRISLEVGIKQTIRKYLHV
jgi:UDP-glucose 4-epimerase